VHRLRDKARCRATPSRCHDRRPRGRRPGAGTGIARDPALWRHAAGPLVAARLPAGQRASRLSWHSTPDALPAQARPGQLAYALDAPGAAAMALGDRFGVPHAGPRARVTVLTRGRLLTLSPDG
jgi:hypothetical protein